jgi:hypothetical protein
VNKFLTAWAGLLGLGTLVLFAQSQAPAPTPVTAATATPAPAPPPPPPKPAPVKPRVHGVYYTCKVTMAEFLALKPGMSYAQVRDVLGCPGVLEVKDDSDDYHGAIYAWNGAGSLGANVSVQFTNGAMIGKAQSGLR